MRRGKSSLAFALIVGVLLGSPAHAEDKKNKWDILKPWKWNLRGSDTKKIPATPPKVKSPSKKIPPVADSATTQQAAQNSAQAPVQADTLPTTTETAPRAIAISDEEYQRILDQEKREAEAAAAKSLAPKYEAGGVLFSKNGKPIPVSRAQPIAPDEDPDLVKEREARKLRELARIEQQKIEEELEDSITENTTNGQLMILAAAVAVNIIILKARSFHADHFAFGQFVKDVRSLSLPELLKLYQNLAQKEGSTPEGLDWISKKYPDHAGKLAYGLGVLEGTKIPNFQQLGLELLGSKDMTAEDATKHHSNLFPTLSDSELKELESMRQEPEKMSGAQLMWLHFLNQELETNKRLQAQETERLKKRSFSDISKEWRFADILEHNRGEAAKLKPQTVAKPNADRVRDNTQTATQGSRPYVTYVDNPTDPSHDREVDNTAGANEGSRPYSNETYSPLQTSTVKDMTNTAQGHRGEFGDASNPLALHERARESGSAELLSKNINRDGPEDRIVRMGAVYDGESKAIPTHSVPQPEKPAWLRMRGPSDQGVEGVTAQARASRLMTSALPAESIREIFGAQRVDNTYDQIEWTQQGRQDLADLLELIEKKKGYKKELFPHLQPSANVALGREVSALERDYERKWERWNGSKTEFNEAAVQKLRDEYFSLVDEQERLRRLKANLNEADYEKLMGEHYLKRISFREAAYRVGIKGELKFEASDRNMNLRNLTFKLAREHSLITPDSAYAARFHDSAAKRDRDIAADIKAGVGRVSCKSRLGLKLAVR